jgi:hypothetical protein
LPRNARLAAAGQPEERMLALRTLGEFWGRQRTVVVTYNPATARKHDYRLERKLEELRDELLVMRTKAREQQPQWRDPETIRERERYVRLCEQLPYQSLHHSRTLPCMSYRPKSFAG